MASSTPTVASESSERRAHGRIECEVSKDAYFPIGLRYERVSEDAWRSLP